MQEPHFLEYQRELRFQAILEAIPDDLMLVDGSGHIREYKAGRSESHIPMDDFLGTRLQELFPAPITQKLLADIQKVFSHQTSTITEIHIADKDFEARIVYLEDDLALILFRDVTAQREADRVKSEFLAAVSHELRTPLASILGYTELLLNHNPSQVEHTEFLESIQHSTLRLNDMVNNLLDASRLEAGRFSVYLQTIDLQLTLVQIGKSFAGVAKLAQVSFVWELDPTPAVQADPERISQVLGNLLSNALKFCARGGTIWLRSRSENGVVLEVEDTGPGIPLAEQGHLFNRYSRTKSAIQRGISGTGLGLYISKAIVEAHQGRIWVESDAGKGAKFCVWLPVSPPSEAKH